MKERKIMFFSGQNIKNQPKPNLETKQKGLTLIEILVVIGIITILAATVIIAINPARQLAQARNARRWSDVNTLLNAIHQYAIDRGAIYPLRLLKHPLMQVHVV